MTEPHSSPLKAGRFWQSLRAAFMVTFMIAGLVVCGITLGAFAASTAKADAYTDAIAGLASPGFAEKVAAIEALGRLGDSRAIPVLEAMADNQLYTRKAAGRLVAMAG